MILKEGDILDHRYQILLLLSDKGGMGLVYQAQDCRLGDTVVIKQSKYSSLESLRQSPHYRGLPEDELRSQAEFLQKAFEREAKLLRAAKGHNALPGVLDYFKADDDDQFLVMDFIPGKDFDELLRERLQRNQGPFPLDQVLDWADQVLDALDYLHTQFDPPIIHRDIKPQNLKLTPKGQVILLDFGLAKGARPGMSVVESVWGGTPEYAPLEQVDEDENEKQKSDPRGDLYSLAVTLHHLLSGQKPARTISRLNAKAQGKPDPLRPLNEIVPSVPEPVSAVLQRAAAVFAKDRLATAAEMRKLLRQAVAPPPPAIIVPQPKPEIETILRPKRNIVISLNPERENIKPVVETRPAQPKWFIEDLGNGVKLEMIYIPGGSFLMGSPEGVGHSSEHPQRRVTLSPFYIGKYPVTQAQWKAMMGENPSHFKGDDLPVESVAWHDAVKFCEVISKRTGGAYRLPAEAEWEYACRAGSTGRYCFGDDESLLGEYAWYDEDSGGKTHPVGKRTPNAWGLFDMHGNVWEWCEDDWHDSYNNAPKDGRAWVDRPSRGSARVFRGGGWDYDAVYCRSALRNRDTPGLRALNLGFRLLRT